MELFYSSDIEGGICRLDQDESGHCVKVLRHRSGDEISVIDGCGTLYRCRITSDSPKGVEAMVLSSEEGWGGHPYHLHMAVCPTKNNDRYEWFAEKACEIGMDEVSPVIGEHSERRVFKTARIGKILVSAAKQSLKAAVPVVNEPVSVKEFIETHGRRSFDYAQDDSRNAQNDSRNAQEDSRNGQEDSGNAQDDSGNAQDDSRNGQEDRGNGQEDRVLRMIAYCFEDERVPRRSIREVLEGFDGSEITILIGPEGDFSRSEAELALAHGFIPVHLGSSRLRTETAALTAVSAVYFHHL